MSQAKAQSLRFNDFASFDTWAAAQPGDWELHDGIPVAMAPERVGHAIVKGNAYLALRTGVKQNRLRYEAIIGGLAIRGPGLRQFEPDVIVACGDKTASTDLVVAEPIILVEVLSPSTANTDMLVKLEAYLALPSLRHYLIIATELQRIIHHRRQEDGQILTAIHRRGPIALDPPGLSIDLADIYEDTDIPA